MIVALDLETTGINPQTDSIIEVALIKFDSSSFEIIETFTTLINPLIPIPELISNITNIYDDDVLDAPVLDDRLIDKIRDFIGDAPILGHNTDFDKDFLINHQINIKQNITLDTFLLANIILPYEQSLNLGILSNKFNIDLVGAHRAYNDTLATIKLFEIITQKFKSLPKHKKELLAFLFELGDDKSLNFYIDLFELSHNFKSKSNFTKKVLKKVSKYRQKNSNTEILNLNVDDQFLDEIFRSLPGKSERLNQLKMTHLVRQSLFDSKNMLIEAPTGVGKTYGYLIPSIIKSLVSGEQVIISTHAKTLQDQIYYNDLDYLSKNIGYKFRYSKLKGKGNYLSIHRYINFLYTTNFYDIREIIFISKITLWLLETVFGEIDEINIYPWEHDYIKNMRSDDFLTLTDGNKYKKYEYLYKARQNATESNIVVVNHSLLIQDSISSMPIFKKINNLVIDEGHNLEDSTTSALDRGFTIDDIVDTLKGLKSGLNKQEIIIDNIDNYINNIIQDTAFLFDIIYNYAISKNLYDSNYFDILIEKDFYDKNDISTISKNLKILYKNLFDKLQELSEIAYRSIRYYADELSDIFFIINIMTNKDSIRKYIIYFNVNKARSNKLSYTILNVGNFLRFNMWDKIPNTLLTGATFEINNNFDYFKNTLSIHDFDFYKLDSDFDYNKQSLLFIPNDLGSSRYNNENINRFILDFLQLVRGNTLMLFTSFASIKDVYLSINHKLSKEGVNILSQGIGGGKSKILSYFAKDPDNSAILGTYSFWEGIDIPGDDLKYLFIHKFPFAVPSEPISKARAKLYKNSFMDYFVPKTIIKTKQGFGRLIRSKDDTGVAILLDDRYITKDWGKLMSSSFPADIKVKIGGASQFLEILKLKNEK